MADKQNGQKRAGFGLNDGESFDSRKAQRRPSSGGDSLGLGKREEPRRPSGQPKAPASTPKRAPQSEGFAPRQRPAIRSGLSGSDRIARPSRDDAPSNLPAREETKRPAAKRQEEPKEKIKWFVWGQGLSFDYGVLICVIALTIFGLVMVLSASSYKEGISGDSLGEFRGQLFWAICGIVFMLGIMNIDYRILNQKWIVYAAVAVTLGLLALVRGLPLIGVKGPPIWSPYVNYSYRWLRVGTQSSFLSLQPSEIAKITMVLFLSWFFSKQHDQMHDLKRTILPALIIAGMYAGLIIMQPNLSTTGAILIVTLIMMYVAGSKWWVNVGLIIGGCTLIVILLQFMPDRMVRYTSFRDPWAVAQGDGWQLIQSYFALANGGWFGTGVGMSRQKHLFLPYSSSDFIFAIVGEEIGFIGASFVILVFFALVFFGIRVAMNAKDRFGCFLATGITAMLAVQVVINIAVVTGSMPTTGLPLPFFTAGGTTLFIFLCSMGLLLSVSRRQNELLWRPKKKKEKRPAQPSAAR